MKSWYPICLNHHTLESGHMIYNHDTRIVEKNPGEFRGNWNWDTHNGCPIRVIYTKQ